LKVGRWKLTETANRVHAAQPSSIISNDVSPQVIRKNNALDNDNQHPSTSNHTNNSNISPLSEENKDVPPPAPLRQGVGEVPHVTVHDENQTVVHSDLSPVTEEPSSQNDLVIIRKLINYRMDTHLGGSASQMCISQKTVKYTSGKHYSL
jgi:hypothetical protein